MRHIRLFNISTPKALVADAGPDVPGGEGANKGFWRRQWKDRLKRFADMGRGVKFKIRLADGRVVRVVGKFQGAADDPNYGRVLVQGDPNVPDGYYLVHSDNGETVIATLSDSKVKKLGVPTSAKNQVVPARDNAAIQDIGSIGYEPLAEGEHPKPKVLKKKMTGAEVQARKMKTVTENLKDEGRFPVPRQTTSDRWGKDSDIALGAKEDYNLVYEQLKDEDEAWKEKYPTFDAFWTRVQELSVGDTTQSPNSLDEIPQEMKDINKAYATRILGLEPDGKITFYRNAVNKAATPENAARGYVTTNADFAYDYNANAENVGTNGRYEVDAQPDEVFGMLGYSKLEDEFGVVVGDGVTQQPGRIRRIGDLEPPKLAPWVEKYQAAVGRSNGGTPYRHHALAGQFDLLPVDDFLGADLNDFLSKNKLEAADIKAKFDELYGSGAYEEYKASGNSVTFSSIKRMFTDLGNGQIGLDITKVDGSEGGHLAPSGYGDSGNPDSFKDDQLDANLKMLAVFQELSGKPFMIHRDNAAGQKLVDKQPVDEMAAALADPFRTKPIDSDTYAPVSSWDDLGFEDEEDFGPEMSPAEQNTADYVRALLTDPKKKQRFKKLLNELEAPPGEDAKLADGWEAMDPREAFARQYGTTIDELREFLDLDIDSPEVDSPLYNDAKKFLFGQYRQWEDAMASKKRLAVKSLRSDIYLHANGSQIIREYVHSRKDPEDPFDDGYAVGSVYSVEAVSSHYNELHEAAPLEAPVRIFLSDQSYNTSFSDILNEEHGEGTYQAASAFATGTDRIVINMNDPILHSEAGDKLAMDTLMQALKDGKEVNFPFSLEELEAIENPSYFKYILAHEYGHLFDHTYLNIRRGEDYRGDEGSSSKEYNDLFHSHEHTPSAYGDTNVSEFFAEHFAHHIITGEGKLPEVIRDIQERAGVSTLPTDKKPIKADKPKQKEMSNPDDVDFMPSALDSYTDREPSLGTTFWSTPFEDNEDDLTETQSNVLMWYTDTGYEDMSAYLRDGSDVSDRSKVGIETLLELIDGSPAKADTIIYRGRPFAKQDVEKYKELLEMRVGDEFVDRGIGSHSESPDRASFYAEMGTDDWAIGHAFFRVVVRKGDKGYRIPDGKSSYGDSEEEVLLPPNTRYRVLNVGEVKGVRVLDVEIISQEPKKPNIEDYSSALPTLSSEVEASKVDPDVSYAESITGDVKDLLDLPQDERTRNLDNKTVKEIVDLLENTNYGPLKVSNVTIVKSPGIDDRVYMSGDITNSDGEVVGTFFRTINRNEDGSYSIEHKILKIEDKKYRGTGFGKKFSKVSEDIYKKLGISKIEIQAGDENGAATWAKAGYDWDGAPKDVIRHLRRFLDPIVAWNTPEGDETVPGSVAYKEKHAAEMETLRGILKRFETAEFGSEDYPTPLEIVNVPEVGKYILGDDTEWSGVKRLDKEIPSKESKPQSSALANPIPVPKPVPQLPKVQPKPKEKVDRTKLPTPEVQVTQPIFNVFNHDEPEFVDGNIVVPDSPEARQLSKLGKDPSEKEREALRKQTLEVLTTDPNYQPLPPKDADFDALTSVGESAFTYVDSSLAINDGLRDADVDMENSKMVKDLDEAMLLSAHLPPGATVYRMLKLSTWKRLNPQVGGVMIDRAFISTSHTRVFSDEAREIDVMTGDVNQIPMRIVMPNQTSGIDLSTISWYDTEDEYLLPRKTALRFLGWDSEGYAVFERIS